MSVYSFINVNATLVGPGGSARLGYGAAVAEEGITVEYEDDRDVLSVGADGIGMHTLRARKNGTAVIRLQKTSPQNAILSALFDYQALSSANWGQNVLTVIDPVRGDLVSCRSVAFRRHAPVTFAQDANMNEWSFNAAYIDMILGSL